MTRALPALLTVLVLFSLPATVLVGADTEVGTGTQSDGQQTAQQQTPVTVENTTNRLPLEGETMGGYVEHTPDLGTALANADDKLRIDHEQYVIVESEFDEASADEREAMIEAAYNRTQNRTEALEERERDAIEAYVAGEQSETEVLGTIARNYHEAVLLDEAINDLETKSYRTSGYSLPSDRMRADRTILEAHRTELRAGIATTSDSETYSVLFEASANASGYRLSAIDGSNYLTETVRFDNRDPTQPDQFAEYESIDRADSLYPWAADSISGDFPSSQDHSTLKNLYWIEYAHEKGNLEVYLDGGTGHVYREVQVLSVGSLPVAGERTHSEDGIELSLDETPANGPAEITVVDSATDEPESATISIDGFEIGTTDPDDGTHWIVPPSGGEYELQVETPSETLNVTVSSADFRSNTSR
ncbi:DUF7096 domain-containing protein [Halopiger xanaduensis]|uniref:Uncharacterized protein n=1 Tax=Halopiger xanaduensis (strain DSM 18323 / JCM 14033 / SH-6) TaxID=797210 RepID=F8D592_HALXS|nr:hypothetical protein [Halopiger xanaduensis]AEH36451.1 hypothetical protein Halxa_1823 [Halopiger xanaduensis SH-6]